MVIDFRDAVDALQVFVLDTNLLDCILGVHFEGGLGHLSSTSGSVS